jgi:hypothetical protein
MNRLPCPRGKTRDGGSAVSSREATQRPGKSAQPFVKWRATVDEDGHYCFAVALRLCNRIDESMR